MPCHEMKMNICDAHILYLENIFFWKSYFNIYLAREIYFYARLKNVGVTPGEVEN